VNGLVIRDPQQEVAECPFVSTGGPAHSALAEIPLGVGGYLIEKSPSLRLGEPQLVIDRSKRAA
jgi:hypothetical protein